MLHWNYWQDVLLRYGAHSERRRESVAALGHSLANSIVLWANIRGPVASRLIPVASDKCPGVWPTGVGETLRRVVCKSICLATNFDVEQVRAIDQLCAERGAGIEGLCMP